MKRYDFLRNALNLTPASSSASYSLELSPCSSFAEFSIIEIELILYPYKITTNTNEGINVQPYDSYLVDLIDNQKTLYSKHVTYGANIFALMLGCGISLVYWIFNRSELFGLQSIVAIFGVYLVGKEVWSDIEQLLIDITEKWRIRYYPHEYSYLLRSETTLDQYSRFGRAKKYRNTLVLADQLDIIRRSNARDIKLLYVGSSLSMPEGSSEHIRLALISFDLQSHLDFETQNFLVAAKVSLTRQFALFKFNQEFFQSNTEGKNGCLDADDIWHNNAAFCRTTLTIGRIKIYLWAKVIHDFDILNLKTHNHSLNPTGLALC